MFAIERMAREVAWASMYVALLGWEGQFNEDKDEMRGDMRDGGGSCVCSNHVPKSWKGLSVLV